MNMKEINALMQAEHSFTREGSSVMEPDVWADTEEEYKEQVAEWNREWQEHNEKTRLLRNLIDKELKKKGYATDWDDEYIQPLWDKPYLGNGNV